MNNFSSPPHRPFISAPPRVTREDVSAARAQHWWGDPGTVSIAQLLER